MSVAIPYMRSARSDQLNLTLLHNIIFHPGSAKLRLRFDGIFLKKQRVFLCCSIKNQLVHYKKRKETVINAWGIINGLEYKTKSEQVGVRSLPVSFTFYLNHSITYRCQYFIY